MDPTWRARVPLSRLVDSFVHFQTLPSVSVVGFGLEQRSSWPTFKQNSTNIISGSYEAARRLSGFERGCRRLAIRGPNLVPLVKRLNRKKASCRCHRRLLNRELMIGRELSRR